MWGLGSPIPWSPWCRWLSAGIPACSTLAAWKPSGRGWELGHTEQLDRTLHHELIQKLSKFVAHGVYHRTEPEGEKIMRGQGECHGDVWFQEKDSQADRAEGRKMKTHQPGWAPHGSARSHLWTVLEPPDVVHEGPEPLGALPSLTGVQRLASALSWVQHHLCPPPPAPHTHAPTACGRWRCTWFLLPPASP